MTQLKDSAGTAGLTYSDLVEGTPRNPATAIVQYVDSNVGSDTNSGLSWGKAKATLAAAVSAAPTAGGIIEMAAGTFPIAAAISTSKALRIRGAGRGRTILLNGLTGSTMLTVTGSKASPITVSSNVAAGALTVTIADASTLAALDYILLRSTAVWSSSEAVPKCGEILQIKSIVGNVLTLMGAVDEPYLTSDTAVVEKLTLVDGVRLEGLSFQQTTLATTVTQAVILKYCKDPLVDDCEFKSLDSAALQPESCMGFSIRNCHFQDLTDDVPNARVGYGVNIAGASRDGRVTACTMHNVRHGVTTNGSVDGVPRHCTIEQCGVSGQSTAAGFDTHPSGRFITYADCWVHGFIGQVAGFNVRGLDCTLVNPQVRGGTCVGIWISGDSFSDMRTKVMGGVVKDLVSQRGVRIEGSGVELNGLTVENTSAAESIFVENGRLNMTFRNLRLRSGAGALACNISLNSTQSFSTFVFENIVFEDTTWGIRFNDGGTYSGAGFLTAPVTRNMGSGLVFPTASTILANSVTGGLRVTEGTNGRQGTATLAAGTKVVANTAVTANSRIILTVQSLGTVAAPKAIAVTARTAGTSFTITSADATDTSVIAYQIFEPA